MIKIENFNVDSAIIDITDVRTIEARKLFKTDVPDTYYREFSFVTEKGNCITLRLHSNEKSNLEVKEKEY